jgi:uncharacterized protein (TIGR02996 family)
VRTFERGSGESAQFWNVERKDLTVTVVYGLKGTEGRRQVWEYTSPEQARSEYERKVKAKQQDGYVELGKDTSPPLRRALEDALAEDPDNLTNHMAYADWLTEQGDPRGEFIHVQMQLENTQLSADERHRLQARERDLLTRHGSGWLGNLTGFLYGTDNCTVRFVRGWIDSLHVRTLTRQFAGVLAASPLIRLLRELAIDERDEASPPFGTELTPLALSAYVSNIRRLRIGTQPTQEAFLLEDRRQPRIGGEIVGLVKKLPRLEELRIHVDIPHADELFSLETLGNLRILEYNFGHQYPLAELARNRSLRKLTHLLCHPLPPLGDYDERGSSADDVEEFLESRNLPSLTHLRLHWLWSGDAGCEALTRSWLFRRLKFLDLSCGWITDHGARVLAQCRDIRRLDELHLTYNALTGAGIDHLREAGVRVRARHQRPPEDPYGYPPGYRRDDEQYEEDME